MQNSDEMGWREVRGGTSLHNESFGGYLIESQYRNTSRDSNVFASSDCPQRAVEAQAWCRDFTEIYLKDSMSSLADFHNHTKSRCLSISTQNHSHSSCRIRIAKALFPPDFVQKCNQSSQDQISNQVSGNTATGSKTG